MKGFVLIISLLLSVVRSENNYEVQDTSEFTTPQFLEEDVTIPPAALEQVAVEVAAEIMAANGSLPGLVDENLVDDDFSAPYFTYPMAELKTWVAPEEILKHYPYVLSGFDDDDRPIWISEIGRYNIRKLVEEGREHLLDKNMQQAIYRTFMIFKARSTPENPVDRVVFIFDADDFNIWQISHAPTVSFFLKLTRKYREFLVRHLHLGFVINVNFVAETLLSLVKPILGNLMEKIEIYGTNKAKWMPQLIRKLPQDQIPSWYGGPKNYQPVQVYG